MLNSDAQQTPDRVSPPGSTILSILEERELSVEEFANRIGRSTGIAQKIVDGDHRLDNDLARRIARTLGASETFWMAREYDYRAAITPPTETSVANLSELLDRLPVRDMEKYGWIPAASSRDARIAECLSFFGVSTLAQWQGRYEDSFQRAAYRRSSAHKNCAVATSAWLRQGERTTRKDSVAQWSPDRLEECLPHFRRMTWFKNPSLFLPKLKALFAGAGVKFAVVRAPKGCTASGAVRILDDGTPHLQLSFRFLSDDQFWFSLFHEIAHLLLHFDKMPFLEHAEMVQSQQEEEANEYASQVIVPIEYREELLTLGKSRFPIIDFAKRVGIAPGLIVGQLQHEGIIHFARMHHLKRRYSWSS